MNQMSYVLPPGRAATKSKGKGVKEYNTVSLGSTSSWSVLSTRASQWILFLRAKEGNKEALLLVLPKGNEEPAEGISQEEMGIFSNDEDGRRVLQGMLFKLREANAFNSTAIKMPRGNIRNWERFVWCFGNQVYSVSLCEEWYSVKEVQKRWIVREMDGVGKARKVTRL